MFRNLSQSRPFWAFLVIFCLFLEVVALYYQYQLDYLPCVLCIHVRMLLALLIILGILGWLCAGNRSISRVFLILTMAVWIWMLERSYQLLATERGWNLGECSMESGLPSWLALEKWFPWLFHIHEPCGYTPYLLFQISMAEALTALSVLFVLACLLGLIKGR
ncbi:MAG: disulfide bond formation protein B [Pseudomonadota bacterium]